LEEMELPALSAIQAREIEAPFSWEEVKKIVMEMPSGRAPGPDGFSDLFFKLCWDIIAEDMLAALDHLHKGQFRNLW
jgi:hypothetical protein